MEENYMRYTVLIPQDITDAGKKYLKDRGYELIIGSNWSSEEICEHIADCDAVLARTAQYTREILSRGKKLKVIARYGVGIDNVDLEAATELGIQVTNTPLANSNSVAEHTLSLILGCAKNLPAMNIRARDGRWNERNVLPSIELSGKTLGLIGFGRIGRMVAQKAIGGLSMNILAYDPYGDFSGIAPEIRAVKNREELLAEADFVTLHIPAVDETRNCINAGALFLMKKTAYLINCARGNLVEETDLYNALINKTIAGAALDVLKQEPPDPANPLLKLENVIFSPHNAGLTAESMDLVGIHAAMGIDQVLTGQTPSWPVNCLKI
jgi:D-3-phosphoglycerate dehydrogenase